MSGDPKFAILEKDGIELGGPSEYVPEAADIKYVSSSSETLYDHIENYGGLVNGTFQSNTVVPEGKTLVTCNPKLNGKTIRLHGNMRVL